MSDKNTRARSTRLMAVQALYQAMQNDQSIASARDEYLARRTGMNIDGEQIEQPDGALLKKILSAVDKHKDDLERMVAAHKSKPDAEIEPLLRSILLCAVAELIFMQDIDNPIIINDYLNVSHAFYGQGEVSLVNAILDAIGKTISV